MLRNFEQKGVQLFFFCIRKTKRTLKANYPSQLRNLGLCLEILTLRRCLVNWERCLEIFQQGTTESH